MKTTLSEAKEGDILKVTKLPEGWGARQKLSSLSIELNSTIKVVHKAAFGGPIIIKIGSSEVAIGRGLSKKLFVEMIKQ